MNTSELTGAALDWAVAMAEGIDHDTAAMNIMFGDDNGWFLAFSTDWAQGGPIIEREKIAVTVTVGSWSAFASNGEHIVHGVPVLRWKHKATGPTPLIAAMRCYVASKIGNEVDVPVELRGETA